jgi:Flp pilus assembly protein TadB
MICAAGAVALALPAPPRLPAASAPGAAPRTAPSGAASRTAESVGWMHRHRMLWSVLAGVGVAAFVQGRAAPVAGAVAAVVTWVVIGRTEPADLRRRRDAVRRDLPHVVDLFAATLRAGAAPGEGVALVCAALPGAASARLAGVAVRLSLGLDPVEVWSAVADDPQLGRLGRTLARAHATGAPVVASVERLADELAHTARAEAEERARAVGVKAALPLGLCLLPAFVLIGIVPLVVALLATLDL